MPTKRRGRPLRLPNGFGSIVLLSGRRRRPYEAKTATKGYTDDGYPIRKTLGYFETWDEAYTALSEYNKNPYDIDASKTTFAQMYEKLIDRKERSPEGIGLSSRRSYLMAFNHSAPLHDMLMKEIKSYHLQTVLDELTETLKRGSLVAVRNLWSQMFDMAQEYDIVSKNYATFTKVNKADDGEHHEPFNRAELDLMWNKVNEVKNIDLVLVMCYSGYRASAYNELEVNLDEQYFRGGIKTKAGKNRIVPIHSRILPLVINLKKEGRLFGCNYAVIQYAYGEALKAIGISGKSMHSTRSTFASQLELANVKDLHIKRLMGHSSKDITKDVYTKVEIEELRKSVEMML